MGIVWFGCVVVAVSQCTQIQAIWSMGIVWLGCIVVVDDVVIASVVVAIAVAFVIVVVNFELNGNKKCLISIINLA